VLLMTGCDRIFYLDRLPEPEHDARVDSPVDAIDTPPDVPPGVACSEFTYDPRTDSYYKVMQIPMQWSTARTTCKSFSTFTGWYSHLVVINTDLEYGVVFGMSDIVNQSAWTGAYDYDTTDMVSGFRYVTTQTPVAVKWASPQPDAPDAQNCARFWVPEGMDDEGCDRQLWAVCECDRFPDP
jgi:hypothetical protein